MRAPLWFAFTGGKNSPNEIQHLFLIPPERQAGHQRRLLGPFCFCGSINLSAASQGDHFPTFLHSQVVPRLLLRLHTQRPVGGWINCPSERSRGLGRAPQRSVDAEHVLGAHRAVVAAVEAVGDAVGKDKELARNQTAAAEVMEESETAAAGAKEFFLV